MCDSNWSAIPRWRGGHRDDVGPADVDLVAKRDGDRFAGDRGVEITVVGDDPGHGGPRARRLPVDSTARSNGAANHQPGPRNSESGLVDPLDDHPDHGSDVVIDLDVLEVVQGSARVPRRVGALQFGDVVAPERRDPTPTTPRPMPARSLRHQKWIVEHLVLVVDQVELVHCEHNGGCQGATPGRCGGASEPGALDGRRPG